MDNLDWDEKALIDKFKAGLKTNVQQELLQAAFMMDTEDIPLERWIELAIHTDDVLFTNQSMSNPGKARTFSGKQANLSNTPKPWVPKEEMN